MRLSIHFLSLFSLIILSLFIFSFSSVAKEDENRPYNATTVEECINEIECVWRAYKQLVYPKLGNKELTSLRWEEDVKIQVYGNNLSENNISHIVKTLNQNLKHRISLEKEKGNFFIIFSDDFAADFKNSYKSILYKRYGKAVDTLEKFLMSSDSACSALPHILDGSKIIGVVVFVNPDHEEQIQHCINSSMFFGLGFPGRTDVSFSIFSLNEEAKNVFLSDLDLLLLKIKYHPSSGTGIPRYMKEQDIGKAMFDMVYESILRKQFND